MDDKKRAVSEVVSATKASLQNKDYTDITSQLRKLSCLLPCYSANILKEFWNTENLELQTFFMKQYFRNFLECLLANLSVDMIEQIPHEQISGTFDVFFLNGINQDALLLLSTTIQSNRLGYKVYKCTSLLESFLRQHKLTETFLQQCEVAVHMVHQTTGTGKVSRLDPVLVEHWDEVIMAVVSLPDKMANLYGREVSPIFQPEQYIPYIVSEIVAVLKMLFHKLTVNEDISVDFLSLLLGKLCLLGHGDKVWAYLIPFICENSTDFRWNRIIEKCITRIPDRCVESTIVPFVKQIPWYGFLVRVLGSAALDNLKIQYVLTNKLLLVRHFEQNLIIQNIVGYVGTGDSQKSLFHKMFLNMFDVWGNGTTMKLASYEQHQYLTKVILVCIAFLSDKDIELHRDELLRKLMPAMQTHLDSPLPKIRRLGMVVAEELTEVINNDGNKLKFEYEKDEEVSMLKALVEMPDEPSLEQTANDVKSTIFESPDQAFDANSPPKLIGNNDDSDLDSDDDLVPFDLSNDTPVCKVKAPSYLRECMEGLIAGDDPDKVDACLLAAEPLVRNHTLMAKEVAVEFTKILLHLQDNTATQGFLTLRFSAMVALTVTAPTQVAEYLTTEFFGRNYNLRQRMDMLEVLAAASQELAMPTDRSQAKQPEVVKKDISKSENSENWRDIVQKRIDSKTRRFGKGKTKPEFVPVNNKFASVAGHFFFPLLQNFDRKEATFNMLGEDYAVLQKYIYTLGIITYSSLHAPIVAKVASSLLEFIWALRYHHQQGVRQSLLFATCMILLAIPNHMLITELKQQAMEAKKWLEDVERHDVDSECQKLALQALVLLENSIKQAISSS